MGGTERSAGILARKPGKMNPPYAGRRTAADATYKDGGVTEARRVGICTCCETPTLTLPRKREREKIAAVLADNTSHATRCAPSPALAGEVWGGGWLAPTLKLNRHLPMPHRHHYRSGSVAPADSISRPPFAWTPAQSPPGVVPRNEVKYPLMRCIDLASRTAQSPRKFHSGPNKSYDRHLSTPLQ